MCPAVSGTRLTAKQRRTRGAYYLSRRASNAEKLRVFTRVLRERKRLLGKSASPIDLVEKPIRGRRDLDLLALFGAPPWEFVPQTLLPERSSERGVYYTLQDPEYRALHQHPRYSKVVPLQRDELGREYGQTLASDTRTVTRSIRIPTAAAREWRRATKRRLDFPVPNERVVLINLSDGARTVTKVKESPSLGQRKRSGAVVLERRRDADA